MKILIGTKNEHKIIEMTRIINTYAKDNNKEFEIFSLKDFSDIIEPNENGHSFVENAMIKARYYYDFFKIATIADDSGLEVEALNNEPGIYSARYASNDDKNSTDQENRNKLLYKMKNVEKRYAHFCCAIAYYDGRLMKYSVANTFGKILDKEIGNNGFGYDSLFFSDDLGKPLGLASDEEKDLISHRGKALRQLLNDMKKD